jgi:hypothetical protein
MLAGGVTTTFTDSRVVVVAPVLLEEPQIQTVGVVPRKLATVEAE